MFRTYQGWLALSETGPNEGTLQVFPNIVLSNVYIILRPFFSPKEGCSPNSFNPDDWKYGECVISCKMLLQPADHGELLIDLSDPNFHGIYSFGDAFVGPRPNTTNHPHLKLDETMVSMPKVYPGDMVFWHCVRPSTCLPHRM